MERVRVRLQLSYIGIYFSDIRDLNVFIHGFRKTNWYVAQHRVAVCYVLRQILEIPIVWVFLPVLYNM